MRPQTSVAWQPTAGHDGGARWGASRKISRLSPLGGTTANLAAARSLGSGQMWSGSSVATGANATDAGTRSLDGDGAVRGPIFDAMVKARFLSCGAPNSTASKTHVETEKPAPRSLLAKDSQCVLPKYGGTFSMTATLQPLSRIHLGIQELSWLRASRGSCLPSVLKPWQGGPAITTSAFGTGWLSAAEPTFPTGLTFRR